MSPKTPEAIESDDQHISNIVMFWATIVVAIAWSVKSMDGIVMASDVHTIKDRRPSRPYKGDTMSKWDKSAYISVDGTCFMEVMLPVLCGGVFFIANFSMVYVFVAALAMVFGLANYAISESSVVLSNLDNLRINDAIARWVGKSVDKPDIDVMSGFLRQWCIGSKGPVLTYARSAFLTYQTSFVFLARILIANALLFIIIGMLLILISRVMNAKIFSFLRRKAKSHDLFVRHVDGQTYIRRSVLIYMVTGLPMMSVLMTTLLQVYG